jgi:hypothetical protein
MAGTSHRNNGVSIGCVFTHDVFRTELNRTQEILLLLYTSLTENKRPCFAFAKKLETQLFLYPHFQLWEISV